MKPGRELDALVAEKVMGLAIDKDIMDWINSGCPSDSFGTPMMATPVQAINDHFIASKSFANAEPKPYSTDIAMAWSVVEKIMKDGLKVNIASQADWSEVEVFERHERREQWTMIAFAESTSLPHAICLAALALVGASPGMGKSELNK